MFRSMSQIKFAAPFFERYQGAGREDWGIASHTGKRRSAAAVFRCKA
jgi:hypothetical protein